MILHFRTRTTPSYRGTGRAIPTSPLNSKSTSIPSATKSPLSYLQQIYLREWTRNFHFHLRSVLPQNTTSSMRMETAPYIHPNFSLRFRPMAARKARRSQNGEDRVTTLRTSISNRLLQTPKSRTLIPFPSSSSQATICASFSRIHHSSSALLPSSIAIDPTLPRYSCAISRHRRPSRPSNMQMPWPRQ